MALLWPSHALSLLDGAPLDGRVAAIVVGVVVPVLIWLRPEFLRRRLVQAGIVALLAVRIADAALLTPQGLCARFSTTAPFRTSVLTIPIEEPRGLLRSWDLRAGWRSDAPACTAIIDRPYGETSAFPAWFVNITRNVADFAESPAAPVVMDISGYASVRRRGLFVVDVDRGMHVTGRIGAQDVSSADGRPMLAVLDAGTHRIALHASLTGDRWRLVPTFDGRDAFSATTLTAGPPRAIDRAATIVGVVESTLIVLLACTWIASLSLAYRASPAVLAWCLAAACVFAAVGATGRFERLSVLLLAGAVFVPVAEPHRNLRGALLLVGVPWLALIAARSLPQIGHFTAYSNDDWLAYQAAGYRIFMNGFWLEGGSKAFDYQPLYRWITGALHMAFGDSSVGEVYWDAFCLVCGAAVAFALVDRFAGFRWGVAAAVATLATFWTGTIWYFVGRGLSEVSAAGLAFIAALVLLRNRSAATRTAALAGVFAVLMFYTRLNHVLFAFVLPALMPRFSLRAVAAYLATFASGVALFATRTWWYTGVFSILYGTSLKNNDTGLRLTTIGSPQVWQQVWHSLRALVWMNEPPSFDPRAVLVVAGVMLSVLAVLHVPKFSRLPVSIAVVTLGACASAFLAHTHNYPGRMSIHLVPFAVAMTALAGAKLVPATR
ncbi:MAG TPA: hypothetical protein VG871_15880 [Vicinamibacterales bacterium]|nr:hypothetical protein [Vicinamibacterales bacterium]